MFHRVKSEGQESEHDQTTDQDEKPQEATEEAQKDTSVDSPDVKTETEKDEQTPLYTEEEPTITQTNSQEKKDEDKTMSEQDNATAEQEDTSTTGMSPYQRPGQAPVRGAGYPGSSSYPGLGGSAGAGASDSDRRLTIGPGITMSGEIESCDYLLVEGTVEAALKGANFLEIAESGVFYGTVEINEATIAGRFEGDITVNGRLTISSTGTVTGSISYKEIEIEAGAVLDGKLTPLASAAAKPAKKPTAPAKAAKPAAPKVEKQPEPANSDGELFSKTAAAAE